MMTQMQQKILLWSAAVLLVLNISTLATIGFHSIRDYNSSKSEETINQARTDDGSEKMSGRYFRDNLMLSQEQMKVFFKINQQFRNEAFSIQIKLSEVRKNMLAEMATESADTVKLNSLSSELGSLHARLKVISYQYFMGIRSICTPEQKIKLLEIFKIFFDTEIPIGNPGSGRNRRGQGWRNN